MCPHTTLSEVSMLTVELAGLIEQLYICSDTNIFSHTTEVILLLFTSANEVILLLFTTAMHYYRRKDHRNINSERQTATTKLTKPLCC